MSTDNFGALGADFFIKTFNKGSSMSQADLDQLVQYVQLTTTIIAIGDFTPDEQNSVWMILERVDVNSASGYTVTNNTDVTMTSGGLVTINSLPWTKITGKPNFFSGDYNDLTNKPVISDTTGLGPGDSFILKNSDTVSFGQLAAQSISAGPSGIQIAGTGGVTIMGAATATVTLGGQTSGNIIFSSATSGINYNDLSNLPSIPAAQVNADWNEEISESPAYIFNKPTIPSLDGYATEAWVNAQGFGSGSGSGVSLPADAQGFLANDGTGTLSWASAPARLVSPNGDFEVALDDTGAVVLSSYGVVKNPDHVNMVSDGWVQMQWVDTNTLENADPNATSGPTNWIYVDGNGIHVETNINMNIGDSTQRYDWLFDNYGKLIMPSGGDIVDSNGTSVLGGSGVSLPANATGYLTNDGNGNLAWAAGDGTFSGNYNDLTNKPTIPTSLSQLTDDLNVITSGNIGQFVPTDISHLTDNTNLLGSGGGPTNEITNTDGNNTWSVNVGSTGVVTMNTARGGIEFGAQPEEGAPQHLHIMRPAGDQGSTDLFFGDDYNYVKLPGLYGSGTQGVEIGSSFDSGSVSTWRFNTDGKLSLPAGGTGGITFPDGSIQTTAYVTSVQKGFFTEFKHNGDNNRVDMEAVAVDDAGNSYVSYSYYSDNDNRRYGGIVKLSSSGAVQWTKDITSPSGNPDYVKIVSLEFVAIDGVGSFLTAYGYYYDNNTNRDVGFNYFLVPETGDLNNSFSTELNVDYATELSDGVFGEENGGPVAVFVGKTYGANLEKSVTILSPSTTDRVYISWADYAAQGFNPGDQVYYYTGGYYGMYVNKFDVNASEDGLANWEGISIKVSVSKDGDNYTYSIDGTNGWGYLLNSWGQVNIKVLGSKLGGVDGVNDLTFDFDNTVFNSNSNNLQAAISNIQGTPYSDAVICSAFNGKDWSTEIGNTLTFEYQLNGQALLTKLSGNGNWTKNLGGTDSEQFESVTVDSSNNIYAVGYYWKTNKGSFVIKYDGDGNEQWAVCIDPDNNTGNTVYSVDMLSDGNIITVANDGIVTKIDSSDGSIMWQIMNDGDPSWDSDFKGTATPDGNYIFANYEDNDYTMYVICVSGTDGRVIWTKRISRVFAGSNGEIYPQNDYDAQYIDCNSTHVVIGATSEIRLNNNTTYNGLVFSLPLDGQDIDGDYGQYVIQSVSLNWNTQSTTSTAIAVDIQTISADTTTVTPNTSNPDFTVTKTNIGGGTETTTPVAGIERHSASAGDNNLTLAEEHNGKFLYYNGSNGNSWIYVPSDNDVNLPIGFTVTVVMDDFDTNRIYVNNNTGSQNATINASGFDYNQTNYWKFGQDGKSGVYTIMKVDTDRWMLAGPDITTD